MNFDWFKLFKIDEFLDENLVSRNQRVFLEGYSFKDILLTVGNHLSISVDGVFLPCNAVVSNPYYREGFSVFIDAENFLWLGIELPE